MRRSQQRNDRPGHGLEMDTDDGLWKKRGKIWIPHSDLELQLEIMITSHCGTVVHRGREANLSILLEDFWWPNIKMDTEALVHDCLHCIITRAGDKVPRPLGHDLHGDTRNEVVHIDLLYMGQSSSRKVYILLIRDDLSGYVWLWPISEANAECAADALCVWLGVFGCMDWLVTDQGSYFKNLLIKSLTEETKVHHHFTTAYCPWANGSVERICREVLRSCKELLGEWKLSSQNSPSVTEAIQSVLNHAPLKRLGLRDAEVPGLFRTPLQVFMGHKPDRPLLCAFPIGEYPEAKTPDDVLAKKTISIDELQAVMNSMHRDVSESATGLRKRQVDSHNRRTKVQKAQFHVGSFVLVRRTRPRGHKLKYVWRRPRRVTEIKSEWFCVVENILNSKQEALHTRGVCTTIGQIWMVSTFPLRSSRPSTTPKHSTRW